MNQPNVQPATNNVRVEGFDEFYQPDPMPPQAEPDQSQRDPVVEIETGPDRAQTDPGHGVSLEEAARVLGLHVDTLRKRLQKGKIRGFKVADKYGDKWLVHKDELQRPRPIQAFPIQQAQTTPDQAQRDPVVEIGTVIDEAQTDPVVKIEIGPDQAQLGPERERLMSIIESQAHQLRAAGDVIVYLKTELEDTKSQVKLLTDSQHKPGLWGRFYSWFVGRQSGDKT